MDQPDNPNLQRLIADRVLIDGVETTLAFAEDGKLRWNAGGKKCLTVEGEVLGFCTQGRKIRLRCVVVKGDRFCCVWDRGGLVRENFVFELFSEDSQRLWYQKLREYIDSLGRPKKLFIFVNPFGGKKIAPKIFIDVVKPLLEVLISKLQCKKLNISYMPRKWLTLWISRSMRGLFVLVVMVWSLRNKLSKVTYIFPHHTVQWREFCVVYPSHKRSLYVATILHGDIKFFSVLMLAWGLVADIDIESEKI